MKTPRIVCAKTVEELLIQAKGVAMYAYIYDNRADEEFLRSLSTQLLDDEDLVLLNIESNAELFSKLQLRRPRALPAVISFVGWPMKEINSIVEIPALLSYTRSISDLIRDARNRAMPKTEKEG
ncbi:MAG: hypothetical protein IPK83_01815 [Planctomycetes bacterium]|nr:hypothetical protein [Planctomycetota bacterium]